MSTARERLLAAAALIICLLVMATSVEIGRTALQAALSGLTAYGTVVVLAGLGLSVGIGKTLQASKTVVTAAVLIAVVLFGLGKGLWSVIA
ncbi:hypothetical protein [Streptomyces sp. NPDC001815]|uniref:hypothetical protein n=1 Tax=Streptomyces sp. NPDC001815 TaxID=3154526 RepID=UPI00331B3EF4